MLKKLLFNLQLFAEGGDGGDGSSAAPAGDGAQVASGDNDIPASIPEKAKKIYQKAMAKTQSQSPAPTESVPTTTEPQATEKISYADLIKSDDYKDEHKAYMDKTIGDRLKKYKGLEENHGKAMDTLAIVANKYGVDPTTEDFLEVLGKKIEEDDSYYEKYAMEHDISPDEARRVVTMERKIAAIEAQKAEATKQEQMRQQVMMLRQNAEKTKSQFPQFDLDTEMQDERFRRLCAVNNGDTTAAYMACHWNEIIPQQVQLASQQIQQQTAQAVAMNQARPLEIGIHTQASSVVNQDFRGMSLADIRAYADEERRKQKGR